MNNTITPLEWDSSFFDKSIGTVRNIANVDVKDLSAFDLITNKVCASDIDSLNSFTRLGFSIAAGELVFSRQVLASGTTKIDFLDHIALKEDINLVVELAEKSYKDSRFRVPWFTERQKNSFYGKWAENAILALFDDVCLIIKQKEQLQGFITLKKVNETLSIGLIAVAADHQGQGVAKTLMALASSYAIEHGCLKVTVATQLSNIVAANLYIRNGFQLQQTSYWLYKGNT